ncbi:unnamed protein product [Amoebophrya sp. A120]|nr:unnamed protein product [Amoebophrya sp. A120]|eukprot:GSA120T00006520001.1
MKRKRRDPGDNVEGERTKLRVPQQGSSGFAAQRHCRIAVVSTRGQERNGRAAVFRRVCAGLLVASATTGPGWPNPEMQHRGGLFALAAKQGDKRSVSSAGPQQTDVGIELRSSWEEVPAAAEVLEFLREVNPRSAVQFLQDKILPEEMFQIDASRDEAASRETRADARSEDGNVPEGYVRNTQVRRFLNLLIRNHFFSPRIEMLRSVERAHRTEWTAMLSKKDTADEAAETLPQEEDAIGKAVGLKQKKKNHQREKGLAGPRCDVEDAKSSTFWLLLPNGEGVCERALSAHASAAGATGTTVSLWEAETEAEGSYSFNGRSFPSTPFDLVLFDNRAPELRGTGKGVAILYVDVTKVLQKRRLAGNTSKGSTKPDHDERGTKRKKVLEAQSKQVPRVLALERLKQSLAGQKLIFRYAGGNHTKHADRLAGYGVKLMIKNTEYKADAKALDMESAALTFHERLGTDFVDYLKMLESKNKVEEQTSPPDEISPDGTATATANSTLTSSSSSSLHIIELLRSVTQNYPEQGQVLTNLIKKELGRDVSERSGKVSEDEDAKEDIQLDDLDDETHSEAKEAASLVKQRFGITAGAASVITLNNQALEIDQNSLGIYPILEKVLPLFKALERVSDVVATTVGRVRGGEEAQGENHLKINVGQMARGLPSGSTEPDSTGDKNALSAEWHEKIFSEVVTKNPVSRAAATASRFDPWYLIGEQRGAGGASGTRPNPLYQVEADPKAVERGWTADYRRLSTQPQGGGHGMAAMMGMMMMMPQAPEILRSLVFTVVILDFTVLKHAKFLLQVLRQQPTASTIWLLVDSVDETDQEHRFQAYLKRLDIYDREQLGDHNIDLLGAERTSGPGRDVPEITSPARRASKKAEEVDLVREKRIAHLRREYKCFVQKSRALVAKAFYRILGTTATTATRTPTATAEKGKAAGKKKGSDEKNNDMAEEEEDADAAKRNATALLLQKKRKKASLFLRDLAESSNDFFHLVYEKTISSDEEANFAEESLKADGFDEQQMILQQLMGGGGAGALGALTNKEKNKANHPSQISVEQSAIESCEEQLREVVAKAVKPAFLKRFVVEAKEQPAGDVWDTEIVQDLHKETYTPVEPNRASLPVPSIIYNGQVETGEEVFENFERRDFYHQISTAQRMQRELRKNAELWTSGDWEGHLRKTVLRQPLLAHHEAITTEAITSGSSSGDDGDGGNKKADQQEGAQSASEKKTRRIPWHFKQLDIPESFAFFELDTRGTTPDGTKNDPSPPAQEEVGRTSAAAFYHIFFLASDADTYLLKEVLLGAQKRNQVDREVSSSEEQVETGSYFGVVFMTDDLWNRYAKPFFAQARRSQQHRNELTTAELAALRRTNNLLADQMRSERVRAPAQRIPPEAHSKVLRWWCNGRLIEMLSGADPHPHPQEGTSGSSGVTPGGSTTTGHVVPSDAQRIRVPHLRTLEILLPPPIDLAAEYTSGQGGDLVVVLDEKDHTMMARVNAIRAEFSDHAASGSTANLNELWGDYPEPLKLTLSSEMTAGMMNSSKILRGSNVDDEDATDEMEGLVSSPAALLSVYALVDPLSEEMQLLSEILRLLLTTFPTKVHLLFTPVEQYTKPPLTNYYRQVVFQEDQHGDESGKNYFGVESGARGSSSSSASIAITKSNVFSLKLEVPDPWLVSATEAEADFDNLIVSFPSNTQAGTKSTSTSSMGKNVVHGIFELQCMYMEGQALVASEENELAMFFGEQPAAGVELGIYGSDRSEPMSDARVLRNHGYFQLAANPGMYSIQLLPKTARDWELVSAPFLTVDSYITPPYLIRVRSRPQDNGMGEKGSSPWGRLLHLSAQKSGEGKTTTGTRSSSMVEQGTTAPDGDEEPLSTALDDLFSATLSKLSDLFSSSLDGSGAVESSGEDEEAVAATTENAVALVGNKADDADHLGVLATAKQEAPVHIFSVASGHLYEKLLSIMILSVRKHTTAPLHFWFVDKFFSPRFKHFIPTLAQKYHFDFTFISYKWPSWLNPQREKQRLIWAYKILFLDVFFPLNVERILFIDADQIVRADVRELRDFDLQGNVYGFVPMGDTNLLTEGYRFWKQGYWKNHLNGKPYHISALFVVDLKLFRESASGDILRETYNQLSRDPNSLANLDQDLPNFAQHSLGIFSLPKEWLWCETWCGSEELSSAKTIDLCQNPLTKEPKLTMAKRIAPEWVEYHDQVVALQEQVDHDLVPAAGAEGFSTTPEPSVPAAERAGGAAPPLAKMKTEQHKKNTQQQVEPGPKAKTSTSDTGTSGKKARNYKSKDGAAAETEQKQTQGSSGASKPKQRIQNAANKKNDEKEPKKKKPATSSTTTTTAKTATKSETTKKSSKKDKAKKKKNQNKDKRDKKNAEL